MIFRCTAFALLVGTPVTSRSFDGAGAEELALSRLEVHNQGA
jgi:hypothetical protein